MVEIKQRILVWDLPVRLFHWLLAFGFATAYGIAKFLGEDSSYFPFHSMVGLTLAVMVLLRILWALIGTKWARFTGLALNPMELLSYFRNVFVGAGKTYIGHNPATSATMLLMFAFILGLGWTGYQKSTGGEGFGDLHSLLATAMLILIGGHISGVFIHSIRHRDGLIPSLIHGHKVGESTDSIPSQATLVGVAFLGIVGFFFGSLASSFDPATQSTRWPVIGTTIPLGESEGGGEGNRSEHNESSSEEREGDED